MTTTKPIRHTGGQGRVLVVSTPTGTVSMAAKLDEVPHHCTDPKCPGNINRLKIEAFDEIMEIGPDLSRGFASDVCEITANYIEATND